MKRSQHSNAADLGLLALRATVGGLMMGHGAQKLWGVLGGYGLDGTAGWLESLGLKPGRPWAIAAGGGEFGSGLLMTLGFLTPVGAISVFGPMLMAWNKAHAGKPIWVTAGGAELPLINMAVGTALALHGPGRYSIDEALGIEVPKGLIWLTVVGVAAGVAAGVLAKPAPTEAQEDTARDELQSQANSAEAEVGA